MKIDWVRLDDFCKDLPEVTSPMIYAKKGFNPDGLFSERIFGPIKNYACACGHYWGRHKVNEVCPDCGVKIQNSNVRRKTMAKIVLPFPVMNPVMFYLVGRVGKTTISNILLSMIYDDTISGFYYSPDSDRYNRIKKADPLSDVEATVIPDGAIVYSGPSGLYQLVKDRAEKFAEKDKNWKFILDNIDSYRILAREIIDYYFKYGNINIADFTSYIEESNIKPIFKEIIGLDLDMNVSNTTILEYLKVINDYNVSLEIKRLENLMKDKIDPLEQAKIGNQILKLKIGSENHD